MFPAKLTAMNKMWRNSVIGVLLSVSVPAVASGQAFTAVGARAAGMGGAFVAVADDASAIYWNPGGLAAGSYFSLLVDGGASLTAPDGSLTGGDGSAFMIGLSMPALGLSYYRLHATTVRPMPTLFPVEGDLSSRNLTVPAEVRLESLTTHHGGITLVQSIYPGVSVGSTVKVVRGLASASFLTGVSAEDALDHEAADLAGLASNEFDLDVGVMAAGGPLKVGLTVRNVLEPDFALPGGAGELTLERQARAGVAYAFTQNWLAAFDADLLKTHDAFGPRREVAIGVEGKLWQRAMVRTGASIDTLDTSLTGLNREPAYSVGGSYAVKASIHVDAHYTTGNDRVGHQWGLAARFVY